MFVSRVSSPATSPESYHGAGKRGILFSFSETGRGTGCYRMVRSDPILTHLLVLTIFWAGLPQEEESAEGLVQVSVRADTAEIHPGQLFHIAIQLEIAPGWHVYWKSAGDSGLPIGIDVTAPEGYRVSETRWPRPKAFRSGEYTDYGYDERADLFVPVTAPEDLEEGKATFQVDVGIFVCSDICLDGNVEKRISLRTIANAPKALGHPPAALVRDFQALPRKATDARLESATLQVSGPAGKYEKATFFPIESPGVWIGKATVTIEKGRFELRAPVKLFPKNALKKPMRVAGLIALGTGRFDPSYEFSLTVSNEK